MEVISPVLCYYYLLITLVFTIHVPDDGDDEPWDDFDAHGPPSPIPELIQIENEISKEKPDQSSEGVRRWLGRI